MKVYMASPDWSENTTSFFSCGFLLGKEGKIFFSNFFSLLVLSFFINLDLVVFFVKIIIVNCLDSYNVQYLVWGKRDSSFWQEYSELFYVRWMINAVLRAKLMSFLQINLNRMQNTLFHIGKVHYFRQAFWNNQAIQTAILCQLTFMRSGEYNIIALFWQLGRVMRQLLTFLR